MKSKILKLLSSVALMAGVSLGASQAHAKTFYYEDTYEEQLWAYVQELDSIDGYAIFLRLFADSAYADLARQRLAEFAGSGVVPSDLEVQLVVSQANRGILGGSSESDPFVRSFDLVYVG